MAVFKCKMCGGELNLKKNINIAECEYCGTKQTVPTFDDKFIRLYNRATQYRLNSEFDKAYSAYESIVSEKNDEPEAYWGMVLSEFGVEYVEDPISKKRIPTCHRTLVKSISTNENYKLALNFADLESRAMYEDEAEAIDLLQKKILNASAKESPYDVFICYKETDAEGNRTEDSVLAQEIYDNLTDKGYNVFFSRITLEDKLGKDYEPFIYAALTSAKVMLVVATDSDNCNAVWVKNEWKRYIDFMKTDKEKYLIPVYKNMSPYAFPDEFAKLQAQDMSKIGAIQDLVRGVEKLVGKIDNSKPGLSEDEKKLLDAFEKSQLKKKNLIKIVVSSIIASVLVAIAYLCAVFVFPELTELPVFVGVFNKNIEYTEVLIPFILGSFLFFTTTISIFFFKQNSLKYIKYSYFLLFVGFSVWLYLHSTSLYRPSGVLWFGFGIVAITTVLSIIVFSVTYKKLPVMVLPLILCLGFVLIAEKEVPIRSNPRDSSVVQVVVTNKYINLRSLPSVDSTCIGVVNKGEIYTVLGSVYEDYSQWILIKNGYGVEGYIALDYEGQSYCEYLPINE